MLEYKKQKENQQLIEQLQKYAIKLQSGDRFFPILDTVVSTDLENFKVRSEQSECMPNISTFIDYTQSSGDSYSLSASLDGDILLLVGVLPLWEGVGEIWTIFPQNAKELFRRNPRNILKVTKKYLNLLPFRRLQTVVRSDFKVGVKFVEHLGFQREGLLKQYGSDKKDYYRYALLKEIK